MGHVVVKSSVVEENGVIGMVKLQEVFESPGSLFGIGFDVMDLD